MKLNKKELHDLAKRLLFELDEEEYDHVAAELLILSKQMAVLDEINTDNIEPMSYPYLGLSFLREDIVCNDLNINALKEADLVDNFVKVKKVVK